MDWFSATWVRGERERGEGGGRGRREGADAQEAHLYAFPLITGRGQWLPLHNGFASASHLLPASLGEEEVEEEEEWRDGHQKLLVSKPNMAMRGHTHTHKCARTHTHECQSATEQHDWSWDKHLSHCQGPSRKTQAYAKGIRGAWAPGLNSASQPKKLLRGALRQKRLCPTSNICYALLSPQNPTYHPFSVGLHYTVRTGGSWLQMLLNSVSQSKVPVLSSFKPTRRAYWVVS